MRPPTGIQANDLIGRKILRGDREILERLVESIRQSISQINQEDEAVTLISTAVQTALSHFNRATEWVYQTGESQPHVTAAASVGYMNVFALTVAGWLMLDMASVAATELRSGSGHTEHLQEKLISAKYFATHILPRAQAHADAVIQSSAVALELAESQF